MLFSGKAQICPVFRATEEDPGRQKRECGQACLPHVESGALRGVHILQYDTVFFESSVGMYLPLSFF